MDREPSTSCFPMALPVGVEARLVDPEIGRRVQQAIGPLIFASREALGQFVTPESRREQLARLEAIHKRSDPRWIAFYAAGDEPVGWCYGYMEDAETFFFDTVGLVPAFRNRGIYTAFLKQLIPYLETEGYERLTTSHHPDNRAVMIPELKTGFNIAGLELHEGCGPLIKMVYLFHEDRRAAFRDVFSIAWDPPASPE